MPIEVQQLRKSFCLEGAEIQVLRGIDLTLEDGAVYSLVGASGVGKSTFLHIAGTLERHTSGDVLYNGEDIWKRSSNYVADFRNRNIGFVFQFHHLLPELTALENVMLPAAVARVDFTTARKSAEALLAEVELQHRLQHRPGELSGGEQQRVAIARALVMRPCWVLADEPTGNLDQETGRKVSRVLLALNQSRKTTLLLVSHNPELAQLASRRLRMVDGLIEECA